MKRLVAICLVLASASQSRAAEQYTNFCCRNGGNNFNAGTLLGDTTVPGTTASFTYTGGSFSTNTFTATGHNPQTDGVTAGMFAQVTDGTNIGRIARIASVTTSTIVLDSTATITVNAGTYTACRVGGAWAGPGGAVTFPWNIITTVLTNSTGNTPRVNFKNDATYSISSGLTHSQSGVTCEGFSSTYSDGGRATIDGSTNTIVLLTIGATNATRYLIFQNNGTTGTNAGISITGGTSYLHGVVVNTVRGAGISASGGFLYLNECEIYGANSANTSSIGGLTLTSSGTAYCTHSIFHSNTGNANNGLFTSGNFVACDRCVFDSNGNDGALLNGVAMFTNCDFYNNGANGAEGSATNIPLTAINCNQVKNVGTAWKQPSSGVRPWVIYNTGYGAGTQANGGTVSGTAVNEYGAVTYASNVTPWNAPATGDFTVTLAAAKNAGRGAFTETASSYTGTTDHPDIGAAQSAPAGVSGGAVILTSTAKRIQKQIEYSIAP